MSEKAIAPHSSTLAWKIPWTEEPGRLQSTGSWRVGHDWATSLSFFTFIHWRRKWQPTPVFLPWRIPGTGKPDGLPSMGSHRVEHDWSKLAAAAAAKSQTSSKNSSNSFSQIWLYINYFLVQNIFWISLWFILMFWFHGYLGYHFSKVFFFCLFISNLIPLWPENILWISSLKFVEIDFVGL